MTDINDNNSEDWPKVSYRHFSSDEGGPRFVQYASDQVPTWAVDVKSELTERDTLAASQTANQ